jgi:dihydroorotase-like cyclic amidohydrolase
VKLVDIFSHFNDPGQEYKETIETGIAAAAAGDYKSLSVLVCNQQVLASRDPVSSNSILITAARQYSATGVVLSAGPLYHCC